MRSTDKLKVLDLFSGIGMFSYGLHQTGLYKTVAFCEWDGPCRKILSKNFPETHCYKDIEGLTYQDGYLYSEECGVAGFTDVDILVGGFPCQDISIAGGGVGIEGTRSKYWKHYARLINEIKPKGVIIENVSALLRRGLDVVLKDLHTLGYDAEWHCITAKHFGAYHERDRIWIIAYRNDFGTQGFEPLQCVGKTGQGWKDRKKDMQQIYESPFRRSDSWPQPLLRRVDVQRPEWVDQIKQLGNTVYWPIVERLGYHLHDNLCRMSNTQIVSEQTTT